MQFPKRVFFFIPVVAKIMVFKKAKLAIFQSIFEFFTGFETKQYCCPVRLYAENLGFWVGPISWHIIYDDSICCHPVLSCPRSHSGHGLQRKCGHLERGLHHG